MAPLPTPIPFFICSLSDTRYQSLVLGPLVTQLSRNTLHSRTALRQLQAESIDSDSYRAYVLDFSPPQHYSHRIVI